MAYTEYLDYTSGETLYAKAKPLDTGTWANGIVTLSENGTTGEYSSSSFADDTSYTVFKQLGGSPASSDTKTGYTITPTGTGLTAEQAAKIALIGTGTALVNAPVSGDGDLLELILETDYLTANGRALEWTFDEITGITTSATGKFGIENPDDDTEVYVNSSGVVTEPSAGVFKVSFDIANTALSSITPGKYNWSVEVLEGTTKITIARNRQIKTRVDIVAKQT